MIRATLFLFTPEHCHTDGRCGSSQFLVQRSEWQHSSPGKLKVGGIVDGEMEVIREVQRIRPSVGVCLLVSRDVEQSEVRERGAAEIRIDTALADGHCQAVGNLKGRRSVAAGRRHDPPVRPPSNPLPFPVPTAYGVYALDNGTLTELDALSEQVPDRRIAMSTPINKPSHTILRDSHIKFVVFRRDLAALAPERVDVRVVAKVMRALTFDAKGKASFAKVDDAWNIRNIFHEFRVQPIPGNPEMLLMQSEKADFALPPGRYVLALRNQGYDFTIPGEIKDPAQCLERTEAANGVFYSDCGKK
jgi:hypothetical protein